MQLLKGISVSPGVALGRAYLIHEIFVGPNSQLLDEHETAAELTRFEEACEKTAVDLQALHRKVAQQVGEREAEIFRAHQVIVRDPAFRQKVRTWIANHQLAAPAALARVLEEYQTLFARMEDPYLKERLADLQDVIRRLSSHLSEMLQPDRDPMPGAVILVAREVLPSQAVVLGDREVAAIVTEAGGQTSHAAILARARGIPAISGVEHVLQRVKNGDQLIVDGRDGHVMIAPDEETTSAYRKVQREFVNLKGQLAANRHLPAISADGEAVELLANINGEADAKAAVDMGAAGIGLFRTEYLFLTHPDVPDEDEQTAAYEKIIAASPPGRVTFRTLDLGGDKTIPYLGLQREANPFMGWRSIRLSFEHPEFFLAQIRAVLRASASPVAVGKPVRLLFPMIATLEEVRKVRSLVTKARRQVKGCGQKCGGVEIGLMLEVPAAAIVIRTLLEECDFISIGSNDLVQYLMAADRDNAKVAHLCQPLSPAVLAVLHDVICACREANKPVTLCGEMAGSPRSFLLLYAMGLRSFSMSPSFVPATKDLLARLKQPLAQAILQQVLKLKTHAQIARFMSEQMDALCPGLKLLDVQ